MALAAFAALAATLGACSSPANDRNALGSEHAGTRVRLEATADVPRTEHPATPDAPSLSAVAPLARGHWGVTTITVPSDGVHAYRTYSRWVSRTDESARQRGEFPTPTTALDLTADRSGRLREMAVGPGWALIEGAAMIPRFSFVQPWEEVRHAQQPIWRAGTLTLQAPAEELDAYRKRDHEASSDAASAPGSSPARATSTQGP
jgi:hypothetical protein